MLIVTRVSYGLKSSGAAWLADLTATLHNLKFTSLQADPDVWIQSTETHYDMVLTTLTISLCLQRSQRYQWTNLESCTNSSLKVSTNQMFILEWASCEQQELFKLHSQSSRDPDCLGQSGSEAQDDCTKSVPKWVQPGT